MLESKTYIATPPGATIREQLKDRGMTQKEFAGRMGMSEKHISKLVNGDVHLTPDMAGRLELVLGIPAGFWNKLEAVYQEKLIRVKRENEWAEQKKLVSKYPYSEMAQWGMVPSTDNRLEKYINLCKFFEVSDLKLLNNKGLMPSVCRNLSVTKKNAYIMRALAQYAKIKAKNIEVKSFSANNLAGKIEEIRNITSGETGDFEEPLSDMLRSCGIALVLLPALKNSFLHGITFYDRNTDKIIVGITRSGTDDLDKFRFSLFHEIAHILKEHICLKDGISDEARSVAGTVAEAYLQPYGKLRKSV